MFSDSNRSWFCSQYHSRRPGSPVNNGKKLSGKCHKCDTMSCGNITCCSQKRFPPRRYCWSVSWTFRGWCWHRHKTGCQCLRTLWLPATTTKQSKLYCCNEVQGRQTWVGWVRTQSKIDNFKEKDIVKAMTMTSYGNPENLKTYWTYLAIDLDKDLKKCQRQALSPVLRAHPLVKGPLETPTACALKSFV